MKTGVEISRAYIEEVLLPVLRSELGGQCDRLAVAIIGTGSDVQGLDDEISRDHHWGPRANVMYLREDAAKLGSQVRSLLAGNVPDRYHCKDVDRTFEVHIGIANLTGVCCCAVEEFFERFLGTDALPTRPLDWLRLCEVDLFHVTGGAVVFDGPGELTRRREVLAYYPEVVWKKRIADWCMYVTGREAPYNYHRVTRRGDDWTAAIYLGQYMKRIMELCFALNKTYAPYAKWLRRLLIRLPLAASAVARELERLMAEPVARRRVDIMIEINYVMADAIHALGLTGPVRRRAFDEGLTDLTLYDTALQLYRELPAELLEPSFNDIEMWERMARQVLFDADDYFQRDYDPKT